ncbi:MAG: class I SAM-dependent methyltransferase [Candidatus Pacebacteria bacterium]|nr:class I SAM-dependent methyltransferase [Candidatus Paceibacterota bacterium]MCF7856949.1 class I SAM-dependent methyltransferase [Candidatus Paceibacterota bacterium]
MFKFIKERLYFLKRWYRLVFTYPQAKILVEESLNYDEYWKEKRGNIDGTQARAISANEKMRADYVARIIGNTDSVVIGDIASGPGVIYNYLKGKIQLRGYIGYEYSEYALNVARSLGMTGVQFDINSERDLSEVQEADYFLMLEILEHIPHSEKVLASMYNKARKGVFFSFPNSGNFLYRLRVLFGRMPAQWIKFPNEHLRFWTYTDLQWWLKALGYKDYEIYAYRGAPVLEKIWPALFAGSFVVYLKK